MAVKRTLAVTIALAVAVGVAIAVVRPWSTADTGEPAPKENLPFEILGPSRLSDGLQGSNIEFFREESWFFVLDINSGLVYRIRNRCLVESCDDHVRGVEWLAQDRLRIATETQIYEARLSGEAILSNEVPTPRRPSRSPTQSGPTTSSDGLWAAEARPDSATVLVRGRSAAYVLSSVMLDYWTPGAVWSPSENLLAFIGNFCSQGDRFDLMILDPDGSSLSNLTQAMDWGVVDFEWHLSGDSIALALVEWNTSRRILGLVDVTSGDLEVLIDADTFGHIGPLAWSPDSSKLLVYMSGGGGFCEGGPPAPPTSVEPQP